MFVYNILKKFLPDILNIILLCEPFSISPVSGPALSPIYGVIQFTTRHSRIYQTGFYKQSRYRNNNIYRVAKIRIKTFFFFFIICHRLLDQPNAPHFPLSLLPTPEDLQRPHGGAIGHIEDHWSRVFETGLVLSGV